MKVELQNEPFFLYSESENDLVYGGELTGTYVLCEHINCENFQAIMCVDTEGIFLISPKQTHQYNFVELFYR